MSEHTTVAAYVQPEPPPRMIQLTMTEAVAQTLMSVAGGISGAGTDRFNMDSVYDALDRLGLHSPINRFSGSFR